MARRTRRAETGTAAPEVDEKNWQDWWALRDELGKRLGGRGGTGVSDAEVFEAARTARGKRRA